MFKADIKPSVRGIEDSFDDAHAETLNGLYKAEVIQQRNPWKTREEVCLADREWVDGFTYRRILGSIEDIPPLEMEQTLSQPLDET